MNSEEVKLVFGLEPSGLLEKVIFAPDIGFPRLSDDDVLVEPLDDVVSVVVGGSTVVSGFSFFILGIFGMLIVIWPAAGSTSPKTTKRLRTPARVNFMCPPWVCLKCN